MANMSNFLEDSLASHIFRTDSFAKPTTIAIALLTAAANETSTGATLIEVANANGYARQSVAVSNATWSLSSGQITNATEIEFSPATGGDWGTIVGIALVDSVTYGTGNVLFYGTLAESQTINNTNQLVITVGDIVINFD